MMDLVMTAPSWARGRLMMAGHPEAGSRLWSSSAGVRHVVVEPAPVVPAEESRWRWMFQSGAFA